MAAELQSPITTERTQKFISDLETQKTILTTCTHLFTSLIDHFTALQSDLPRRTRSLDSKFQSLESKSAQSLHSLSLRQSSLPDRESSAASRVRDLEAAALSDFECSRKCESLADAVRSLSRRMDSAGLLRFVISKRKESATLRAEIPVAIMEAAVDPVRLVLDAVEEFLNDKMEKVGVTDKRWACGVLVQAIFPEGSYCFGGKEKEKEEGGPVFARSVVERAAGILERWKKEDGGGGGGVAGPAEAVMFLQMVVGFGLKSRFEEEFLTKLVMEHAARRDMAKIAPTICVGEKLGEVIDELVNSGKEIEAVYFANESGLTERFPAVPLLKSYLKNSRKRTTSILKNGNNSAAAVEESNTVEFNSIKAIIKCVEDNKLESSFSLDSLRKRSTQLEKANRDRKKNSVGPSKPQNKRGHGASGGRGSGAPGFPAVKAAKVSNAYSPYNHIKHPAPPAQNSLAARYSAPYNYHSQSVYEGRATTPYGSSYSVSHMQSPAAISQQHYSVPMDNMAAAGLRSSGSYGGHNNYAAYDYGSTAPTAYQPSS